nr:ABC transporter transmembrane domain-containing protein [Paenibacillus sp. P22]
MRSHAAPEPDKAPLWPMFKRLFLHVKGQWPLLLAAWLSMAAVAALQFVIPKLTQYAVDHVIPGKLYGQLLPIAGAVLGTAVLLGVFGYISSYTFSKAGQQTVFEIRNRLYRHLQSSISASTTAAARAT